MSPRACAALALGLAAAACGSKDDRGSWQRSRAELCSSIEGMRHDVKGRLDALVAELTRVPSSIEAELAASEGNPLPPGATPAVPKDMDYGHRVQMVQRSIKRCQQLTGELFAIEAELRGFARAAGAVDVGRPDTEREAIASHLTLDAGALRVTCEIQCDGTACDDWATAFAAKAVDPVRATGAAIDTRIGESLAACAKAGWKPHPR